MWTVSFVNESARAELAALPADMQARFKRIVTLIQTQGLERTREPYVKHLEGPLWEMRLKGQSGIARSVYVTTVGRKIVVLRTFVKKTEKTPRHEIELALKPSKEIP